MKCYQCVHLIIGKKYLDKRIFLCKGEYRLRLQDPMAIARACSEFALDYKVEWLEEDIQRRIEEVSLLSAETWRDVLWGGIDKVGLEKKCERLERELAEARAALEEFAGARAAVEADAAEN